MHKIIEKKPSEIKLEIEISKEELKKATDLVVADLGKSLKIAGFRPGKAPLLVVEREVGKDKFWAEVVDRAIPDAYFSAIIKEKISAISQPQIKLKSFVPGESLVFEATVAIMPEIKDLKYKGFKVKNKAVKITDKDVETALSELVNRVSERKKVDRSARSGDFVEIDFEGTIKGLEFEGGKSKNHPLTLGSGTMVPGFEDQIIGHKVGEEFNIDVTFPKEYHAANLAGQKTNFKIKINDLKEIVVPALDDELAKKYGFDTLAKLKEELKKELLFQKELEEKRKIEEEIISLVIQKNKLEAPSVLVEEQIHNMVHEAEHNLSHSGLTMDKFLDMNKKTLADIQTEMKPEAERRVQIGLVLGEVAKLEKIEVTEKDIDAEIDRIIKASAQDVSSDDVRAAYNTQDKRREIGNSMVIRQAVDKLWEYNIVK